MIDTFALGLTHGLMLLAAWRLVARPDLDDDHASAQEDPRRKFWARLRGDDRA